MNKRKLIVMGDRVLIAPDVGEERTKVGLYLPQTVVEKDSVQTGRIVATGPGMPMPNPWYLNWSSPAPPLNSKRFFLSTLGSCI